jgi:hypothetical protein
MAREQGWLQKDDAGQISLKETAFLVMNAFEIKGGVLYALFHNPRYAYRELCYRDIIQGRSDPDFAVSGHRLLQIIARAADYAQKTKPRALPATFRLGR